MRMGPVILLLGTAALVGWIAPELRAGGEAAGSGSHIAGADTRQQQESRHEAWLAGETVLERQPDGHFYANALVGSSSARFLVDTGASMVALTRADAETMGLDWSEADLIPIGRGASGTVYGVPVRLERVELGGFEASDVEAAIIPDGLDVSLLGQSFLSKLHGVRIDGDRMVIGAGD